MLKQLYMRTVKPVTYNAILLTSYTRGYSDVHDYIFNNKITSYVEFMQSNTESILLGIGIGVSYPISIPALAIYIYMDTHKD